MWCVKLSDSERDALRALIKEQAERRARRRSARRSRGRSRRSSSARWDDLPEASLPWDRVAELASQQGIGEADVVWDLAAGMATTAPRAEPPPPSRALPQYS